MLAVRPKQGDHEVQHCLGEGGVVEPGGARLGLPLQLHEARLQLVAQRTGQLRLLNGGGVVSTDPARVEVDEDHLGVNGLSLQEGQVPRQHANHERHRRAGVRELRLGQHRDEDVLPLQRVEQRQRRVGARAHVRPA